jgi:DNA-binding NtrC family response regulator
MKILVVDDDAIVIKSCKRILEAEGLEVSTVPSADEALEMIKKYEFDLLLIDVKMPRHDGMFLMREILKVIPDMPIVVMSGYPTPETVSDVLKLGATQFIPKPFRPDELVKTIRPVLQKILSKKSFPTGAG